MVRLDFVSNSSSSSTIIISNTVNDKDLEYTRDICKSYAGNLTIPSTTIGFTEFGWEFKDYNTFGSKLNFCAIQIHDLKEYQHSKPVNTYYKQFYKKYTYSKCLKMLENVCKNKFNLNIKIRDFEFGSGYYIDHQSSVTEGRNMDMFENEDTLYKFLASSDSYISGGNDNVGCYEEECYD